MKIYICMKNMYYMKSMINSDKKWQKKDQEIWLDIGEKVYSMDL